MDVATLDVGRRGRRIARRCAVPGHGDSLRDGNIGVVLDTVDVVERAHGVPIGEAGGRPGTDRGGTGRRACHPVASGLVELTTRPGRRCTPPGVDDEATEPFRSAVIELFRPDAIEPVRPSAMETIRPDDAIRPCVWSSGESER